MASMKSSPGGMRADRTVETDTQRLGATRRVGDHAPGGAMPLRAAHLQPQACVEHYRRPQVEISAIVKNSGAGHLVSVRTDGATQALTIPGKASGHGSSVNGGEFLLLALATCYCNDLYREAARLGIGLSGVEVEATADFPGVGLAATNIRYRANVSSPAGPTAIADLLRQTDAVAEVHKTVRSGVPVVLVGDRL